VSDAAPVKVLHLTDPHLFADLHGDLRGTVTYESLQAVLDHYLAANWRADIVVVTGDVIQDDSAEAYSHFRDLLTRLGLPVYCLPGNHDVRPLMQQALGTAPFYYCEPVEAGDWLIANIDSCETGAVGGRVTSNELRSLDELIARTSAAHVMVCLHHPPALMGSRWLDSVGLQDKGAFLESVGRSGKVRLIIFGHVHQAYEASHDGMRIIGTPSTCRQFAQGSDEFAVDDNPPAYRRISLYTDGRFEHDLIWVTDEPV
jgi:Icc protein